MSGKINKNDVKPQDDPCGLIRQLYASQHLTFSHVAVVGDAKSHMHKHLEEIYYVTKGKGALMIGDRLLEVKEGDLIPIPKNTYHQLRKTNEEPFEIVFVTYPAFDLRDVFFAEK